MASIRKYISVYPKYGNHTILYGKVKERACMIEIGKHVKVISKTSRFHKNDYGRVVGYTNTPCHFVKVYFSSTDSIVNFCEKSLQVLN